ncbi:hypothetical protein [Janthinobacterium sp.]|uniref:hypothetical protein n=1 Tax=Janthinobacterium sp. TaxID=1871054 RepID=UPI0025873F15|nr:hypothetical protein [Janthinobacterium sp.]MCX7289646.1 hypothetical protein [Janthinobacterium sp.]
MTTIQFDLNVPQSSFLQLPHKFCGLRGHLCPLLALARHQSGLLRADLSADPRHLLSDDGGGGLLEQDHMLYGRVANLDAVSTPYYETYAAPLQIEGI